MGKVVPKAVPAAGMILILGIFPFFEILLMFFPHCFTADISTDCSKVQSVGISVLLFYFAVCSAELVGRERQEAGEGG